MSQVSRVITSLDKDVRAAYTPWHLPLEPRTIQDRDPYADMASWRMRYLNRTEPTWNERLIYERRGEEDFTANGLVHLASIDNTLIESSDHTTYQPGWYAVAPCPAYVMDTVHPPFRVHPHLMIQRVYPDSEDRELTYFRRTYQHPSREYAMDVARQVVEGEIRVWGWHKATTLESLRRPLWNRVYPEYLEGATVYRQPDRETDAFPDMTQVTRTYLRERGEPT